MCKRNLNLHERMRKFHGIGKLIEKKKETFMSVIKDFPIFPLLKYFSIYDIKPYICVSIHFLIFKLIIFNVFNILKVIM